MAGQLRFPPVCQGCRERHMGCHDACGRYNAAKEEHQGKIQREKTARHMAREADAYHVAAVKQSIKRRNRRV